jgi:hypothetical protein
MSQNVAECRNNALLPPIELHNFIKYNHLRLAGPGYGACTCCAGMTRMTPLLPAGAFQSMPMARLSTR